MAIKLFISLVSTGVFAYVILKNGVSVTEKEIIEGLKELVKKKIAAFAVPTAFLVNWYNPNFASLNHCYSS